MNPSPVKAGRFRPLPLLRNGHLQTALAFFIKGSPLRRPTRVERVELPDGDKLLLYDSAPPGWNPTDPTTLLVHGLGGCHRSSYLQRTARRLLDRGIRVVRMDMRGAGDGAPLARHFYHAGRSEDLRHALAAIRRWAPQSPLWLVGFSLGGNLSAKLAGEAADDPVPGLARVATIAAPIDVYRCWELMSQPHNRHYDRFFARELVKQARRRHQLIRDDPPLPRFPTGLTLRQFDDRFTAPRCGFADAIDYYRRSSAFPLIPKIQVPALLLTARDDPFVAADPYEELHPPANVTVQIEDHGGHLAFLGWDGSGAIRWAERRVVDWLTESRGIRSTDAS
jgi:hypothetical protein